MDFGGTEINIDKKDLENAKENLFFTQEDHQPSGVYDHENVREINAYKGETKITEFKEPIKVTLNVDDFGFGDASPEELNGLIVMVQNEVTGIWELNGGIYDPLTNTIALYRIHMSKYTIVKNKKRFSDVENSTAKDTINNMLGKGIVDANESFQPDSSISREEFAAWICRAYGLKEDYD